VLSRTIGWSSTAGTESFADQAPWSLSDGETRPEQGLAEIARATIVQRIWEPHPSPYLPKGFQVNYFDALLVKLSLTMADFIGADKDEAFMKVFAYLKALYATIKTAPATTDAEKVVPAYVKAWEADEEAAKTAHRIAVAMVNAAAKHEGNAAVMFHLQAAIRSTVLKYVAGEVDWHSFLADKAENVTPVSQSSRAIMAAEYQEGRVRLTQVYGLIGHELKVAGDCLATDGKNTVPNLPALPGNYGANGGASGSNAKVYKLSYIVDGTDYGCDPKSALRAIFTGPDRIGKTTTDLATTIEAAIPNVYGITAPATFKYGAHTVIVSRPAK